MLHSSSVRPWGQSIAPAVGQDAVPAPASPTTAGDAAKAKPEPEPATQANGTSAPVPSQIIVYGRGEKPIGSAGAASEGGVAGADTEVRPLPSDPDRRHGYELTGFWKWHDWLAVDTVWTGAHSRYVGGPAGQNSIPGALESSGEPGVSAIFPEWNMAARLRYLGPHPLKKDNSQRGSPTKLVNLCAAWTPTHSHGIQVYADLLNVFDGHADDIDYFYTTRPPGEPPEGVDGINSRIVEPRQLRVGFKKTF